MYLFFVFLLTITTTALYVIALALDDKIDTTISQIIHDSVASRTTQVQSSGIWEAFVLFLFVEPVLWALCNLATFQWYLSVVAIILTAALYRGRLRTAQLYLILMICLLVYMIFQQSKALSL